VSAVITAAFEYSFTRFFASLRMRVEMSMPTTSLTFFVMRGKSKPVPQPASSMRFSFLRLSSVNAVFIFASCSSQYRVSYTLADWL